MQNIPTKLPAVISQERKATTPFEAWNYLITDEILDNIFRHTNQYILIHLTPTALVMPNSQIKLRWKLSFVFCV
jgi:hypothetical protein